MFCGLSFDVRASLENTIEFLVIIVLFMYFLVLWFKVVLHYTPSIISETRVWYYLYQEIYGKQLIFSPSSFADFKRNSIMKLWTMNNTWVMNNLTKNSI